MVNSLSGFVPPNGLSLPIKENSTPAHCSTACHRIMELASIAFCCLATIAAIGCLAGAIITTSPALGGIVAGLFVIAILSGTLACMIARSTDGHYDNEPTVVNYYDPQPLPYGYSAPSQPATIVMPAPGYVAPPATYVVSAPSGPQRNYAPPRSPSKATIVRPDKHRSLDSPYKPPAKESRSSMNLGQGGARGRLNMDQGDERVPVGGRMNFDQSAARVPVGVRA
jgi:hypothetical protein